MTQSWTYDSVDLTTPGYNVQLLGAPLTVPERRAENVIIPGRTGRMYVPKVFDQRIVSLGMFVTDEDEAQLLASLDLLRGLFARDGQHVLRHVMGGVTRQVNAEVVNFIEFRPLSGFFYRFVVEFLLADPLWRAVAATTVGPVTLTMNPQNVAVTNAGTYRVEDAVITLTGVISAPRLTIGGTWVECAVDAGVGETLILDTGDFTAELDGANVAGNITHDGDLLWLPLETGNNTLVVSAASMGAAPNQPTITVTFSAPYI